jgi:hypothetical protein
MPPPRSHFVELSDKDFKAPIKNSSMSNYKHTGDKCKSLKISAKKSKIKEPNVILEVRNMIT